MRNPETHFYRAVDRGSNPSIFDGPWENRGSQRGPRETTGDFEGGPKVWKIQKQGKKRIERIRKKTKNEKKKERQKEQNKNQRIKTKKGEEKGRVVLLSKTDEIIKMINLLSKTDEIIKNDKFT